MEREGNPCSLLVGMYIGAASVEISIEVYQKIKNRNTTWPRNSTENAKLKKWMYLIVLSSIIYNCQGRKQTKYPLIN